MPRSQLQVCNETTQVMPTRGTSPTLLVNLGYRQGLGSTQDHQDDSGLEVRVEACQQSLGQPSRGRLHLDRSLDWEDVDLDTITYPLEPTQSLIPLARIIITTTPRKYHLPSHDTVSNIWNLRWQVSWEESSQGRDATCPMQTGSPLSNHYIRGPSFNGSTNP